MAEHRRDRDHALPPRPLGRPRPVGLGQLLPRRRTARSRGRQLWVQPGGARVPRRARGAPRLPRHVRAHVPSSRSTGRTTPFSTGALVRDADAGAALHARDVRLPRREPSRVLTYSGDSAPSDELVEAARDADLFVCEATLLRGELDGEPRGHLSLDEAVEAFEASGATRLLVTHRPSRAAHARGVRARVRRPRARRLTGSEPRRPASRARRPRPRAARRTSRRA